MHDLLRALLLLIPAAVIAFHFSHRDHGVRFWAGALLAYLWQSQSRLALYALGVAQGWLVFKSEPFALAGVPMDFMLGLALLLGPCWLLLPFSRPTSNPITRQFWFAAILDFTIMLGLAPLELKNNFAWLWLGFVALVAVPPALMLAHWTIHDRHIYARNTLQAVMWLVILFWLFPSLFFKTTGETWSALLGRNWQANLLLFATLLPSALILCSAVFEFAHRGNGTAFPYDPPKRLVTTGVYAYISNPMQTGLTSAMALWGWILESVWITSSALVMVLLFIAFKDVCNGSCQVGQSDPRWRRYQREVPKWLPRINGGHVARWTTVRENESRTT